MSYVSCAPSYVLGGYGYSIPAATSYSSRIDYQTPVVAKTVVETPIVASYGHGLGYGSAYGALGYPYDSGVYYGNGLTHRYPLSHGYGYSSVY